EDDGAAVAAGVVDVEGDGGGSGGGLDAGHGWCSFDDDDDGRAGPFVRDARCGASGPQRRGTARSALGPRPVAAHDGPVRTYPGERWVRGYLGDVAVVDTRRPLLFWEDGFPPSYAFDPDDVRTDLLEPGAPPGPGAPF